MEPGVANGNTRPATTTALGLSRKFTHKARLNRDPEAADLDIGHRTLDEWLERGEELTRAVLENISVDAAKRGMRPRRKPRR